MRRNAQCSFLDRPSIAEDQQTRLLTPRSSFLNHEQSQLYYWGKTKTWVDRYFEIIHPRWPFIHRGSFDMGLEIPLLLQSMIAIAMWTSGKQSARSAAVELYDQLDFAIKNQRVCRDVNL